MHCTMYDQQHLITYALRIITNSSLHQSASFPRDYGSVNISTSVENRPSKLSPVIFTSVGNLTSKTYPSDTSVQLSHAS